MAARLEPASCHPRATSDGQARSRADNHGYYYAAAELASRALPG
jgi:hypothetical protein